MKTEEKLKLLGTGHCYLIDGVVYRMRQGVVQSWNGNEWGPSYLSINKLLSHEVYPTNDPSKSEQRELLSIRCCNTCGVLDCLIRPRSTVSCMTHYCLDYNSEGCP